MEVRDVDKKQFAERVASLRIKKGVSAREMSQTLELSDGYINNIENCVNYPSMKVFFLICDYFEITPQEFFDPDCNDPKSTNELFNAIKDLNPEQQSHIIALAKALKK
ncbi:MAG: helix-turn-helix domain-containing protein [Oscillospiraceae bacterium]|nr:helix-turn-helix domain-containing protein [Oscillospiraceae bacterium]